jgi:hypothetical protein
VRPSPAHCNRNQGRPGANEHRRTDDERHATAKATNERQRHHMHHFFHVGASALVNLSRPVGSLGHLTAGKNKGLAGCVRLTIGQRGGSDFADMEDAAFGVRLRELFARGFEGHAGV